MYKTPNITVHLLQTAAALMFDLGRWEHALCVSRHLVHCKNNFSFLYIRYKLTGIYKVKWRKFTWMNRECRYLKIKITGCIIIIIIITIITIITIIIKTLTARVVGAPHMILQPVFSFYPCSPLPFGTCRTQGLSIPWCCLPTSSSVCLVFFPLSLCLARWSWSDLMNGKYDHTTAVCVSLRSSGALRVVQLPAGSWHGLPRW